MTSIVKPASSVREFDIHDQSRIVKLEIGAWDFYVDRKSLGSFRPIEWCQTKEFFGTLILIGQMIDDILHIDGCFTGLLIFFVGCVIQSIMPAIVLWYSAKMLIVIENSIQLNAVDEQALWSVASQSIALKVFEELVTLLCNHSRRELETKVNAYFDLHILRMQARLDCPTHDDPGVQKIFKSAQPIRGIWNNFYQVCGVCKAIVEASCKFYVLVLVLLKQEYGLVFAVANLLPSVLQLFKREFGLWSSVWAAKCADDNYLRLRGLQKAGMVAKYRKELVASNLDNYITSEFAYCQKSLRSFAADIWDSYFIYDRGYFSWSQLLLVPIKDLSQVLLLLHALQAKSGSGLSQMLGSIAIIQQNAKSIHESTHALLRLMSELPESLISIRRLYELKDIQNKVEDGKAPFPENKWDLRDGIAVEFVDVSFKYPARDNYALKNVSFKFDRGQLCVIVGVNGCGKSTVMKLLLRLYDPQEGHILLNGINIRTMRLQDLRHCISVMFQDFALFPVSVKENIGMGNPTFGRDQDLITQAADLGGATNLISTLKEGFDTYLEAEHTEWYHCIPDETTSLFGKPVNPSAEREIQCIENNVKLSGGEEQRLALSRSFMRTIGPNNDVALLMFDEPSAALDPVAEYELFEHLRNRRGSKSMMFSSHRFGNLTRHADVILYMKEGTVVEAGTHDQLVKLGGGYAHMYKIQSEAFIEK